MFLLSSSWFWDWGTHISIPFLQVFHALRLWLNQVLSWWLQIRALGNLMMGNKYHEMIPKYTHTHLSLSCKVYIHVGIKQDNLATRCWLINIFPRNFASLTKTISPCSTSIWNGFDKWDDVHHRNTWKDPLVWGEFYIGHNYPNDFWAFDFFLAKDRKIADSYQARPLHLGRHSEQRQGNVFYDPVFEIPII